MDDLSKEALIKAKTLAEISEGVYRPLSKPNQDWKRLSNEKEQIPMIVNRR